MLDKTVPYAGVYMSRKAGTQLIKHPLPDGFRLMFYTDGDDGHWARLETSVLEFDSEFSALMYFKQRFLLYAEGLYKRCLFIKNDCGVKVATATAWWDDIDGVRYPWLHWVAVDPSFQGLGLGKALVSRVMELMMALEGDVDFYLHTQTWSYKAIDIYRKLGFELTDEKTFYRTSRDNYKKAVRILKCIEKKRGRLHD